MGVKRLKIVLVMLIACAVIAAGCGGEKASKATTEPRIVHIGYYGGTCEAPIFIAYENGIFKKNGLNVELVKIQSDVMKESVSTGKLDALLITPGAFKAIEQGLDLKIVDGAHTGCIQAVAPVDSPIKSIVDLKGKTVGVDSMGGVPMTLLSMELIKLGINPSNEVNWKVYPGPQLSQALEKNQIDAFATWDPFPEIVVREGKARVFFSNTHYAPHKDQFCCYVGMNGQVVNNEPEVAKMIVKSLAEADEWITAHPQEAAQISIDKKYTGGNVALNSDLLSQYKYISDTKLAKKVMLII